MTRDEVLQKRLEHLQLDLSMLLHIRERGVFVSDEQRQLLEEKIIILEKWIEELKVVVDG